MARYTVHVKGEGPEALARARFVKDGFSWLALTFGALWFLVKGAWISALLLFSLQLAISMLLQALGLAMLIPFVSLLVNFLAGLESGAILGWELGMKGHRLVAVISGDDRDAMERRFFEDALGESAAASPPAAMPFASAPVPRAASGIPVIGLFPSPTRPGAPRS